MRLRTLSCTLSFAGLSLLASAVLLAQGQSERPQFRAGVELLQLDVVVLDNKRQPVRALTAADFTGTRQRRRDTDSRVHADRACAAARKRRRLGRRRSPRRRHQSGRRGGRTARRDPDGSDDSPGGADCHRSEDCHCRGRVLGPHDLAAVVSTNNSAVQTRAVQNLTADRTRLLDAINAADPSTGMSGTAEGIMNMPGSPFKIDPLNDSRCLCGLCVLETITRVAEAVQVRRGGQSCSSSSAAA